jgi:DnaJ like chaperone protein
MVRINKWLTGGIGWFLGGPIGGIIGFAVGALLDSATGSGTGHDMRSTQQEHRGFMVSLLVLIAAVVKADGKVMQSELNYVKRFLLQQFGEVQAQQALVMLRDILKQPIPLQDVCHQIRDNMDIAARRELLHLLFGIAAADGEIADSEVTIIEQIAQHLGLSAADAASAHAMFAVKDIDWAYKVLEIKRSATPDEIKRAYRSMAQKHHPDKVARMGSDIQQAAAEKFKKIKQAYEYIKNERSIN